MFKQLEDPIFVQALKEHLSAALEPICDANPVVLADYVIALLQHDRPLEELKVLCLSQLEDFLKNQAEPFVNDLFHLMTSNFFESTRTDSQTSFIETQDATKSPAPEHSPSSQKEPQVPGNRVEQQIYNKIETLDDQDLRYHKRRERSPTPNTHRGSSLHYKHDRDYYRDRERDRDRNSYRDDDRRSPSTGGESNPTKRRRNYQAEGVDTTDSLYPVNPSPIPSYTASNPPYSSARGHNMASSNGGPQRRLPTGPRALGGQGRRPRCRDFDERGYCMRGDLCPFEHVMVHRNHEGDVRAYDPEQPVNGHNSGFEESAAVDLTPDHSKFPHFRQQGATDRRVNRFRKPYQIRESNSNGFGKVMLRNKLMVENIPSESLNVANVKEQFQPFGEIVDVQIYHEKSSAMIQFGLPEQAQKAYESPDPLFGNRFVRMYWFRGDEGMKVATRVTRQDQAANYRGEEDEEDEGEERRRRRSSVQESVTSGNVIQVTIMSEAEAKAKKESAKRARARKERLAQILELQKRKERLLQAQIVKQKLLLKRLESPNLSGADREQVLKSLRQLMNPPKESDVNRARFREDVEREQIDKELEVLTQIDQLERQHEDALQQYGNEDARTVELASKSEELRNKLRECQEEARRMGLTDGILVGGHGGGGVGAVTGVARGRGRGRGWTPAMSRAAYKLDLRTTKILVKGITNESMEIVKNNFVTFGQIEYVEERQGENESNELVIQYSTRHEAEKAMLKGSKLKDLDLPPLLISWEHTLKKEADSGAAVVDASTVDAGADAVDAGVVMETSDEKVVEVAKEEES